MLRILSALVIAVGFSTVSFAEETPAPAPTAPAAAPAAAPADAAHADHMEGKKDAAHAEHGKEMKKKVAKKKK